MVGWSSEPPPRLCFLARAWLSRIPIRLPQVAMGATLPLENQPLLRRFMPAFSSPGWRTLSSQRPVLSRSGQLYLCAKYRGSPDRPGGHQPCPGEAKDRHPSRPRDPARDPPTYYYWIHVYPRGPSEPCTRPNPIAKNCPVRDRQIRCDYQRCNAYRKHILPFALAPPGCAM